MSGVAMKYISLDVRIKFGDSRSNRSRDIRAVHFVMDDNDADADADERRSSHKAQQSLLWDCFP